MKGILIAVIGMCVMLGCAGSEEQDEAATDAAEPAEETEVATQLDEGEAPSEQDLLNKEDPAGLYGEALALSEVVSIAAIHETPDTYEGERVRVEGTVTEVCPKRGCWVNLIEEGTEATIRVKVVDGEIVFPLSAKGHRVVVEGLVEKIELDEEQARSWREHEAEELGVAFDPASVTGPEVIWRIKGKGAQIES